MDDRSTFDISTAAPEPETVSASARALTTLMSVPLFFLGVGIYRAWIELVYVRPLVTFPTWRFAGHDLFDGAFVVVLLGCAALYRLIEPIAEKRWLPWIAAGLMVAGTAASFGSIVDPALARAVAAPGAVSAGAGTALMVLLWSEFLSRHSSMRVALYYSMSLLVGAATVLLMRGFVPAYQPWFMMVLPVAAAACVVVALRAVPRVRCPLPLEGKFSFPWKPVALMAVYALAYGMRERAIYAEAGPHSSWGVVFVAAVVMIGILFQGEHFDFSLVYRVGMPLMVGGLLLVPLIPNLDPTISNLAVSASYTAFSILILLILSNISFRYGASAVWLFGIERGLRALVMWVGRESGTILGLSGLSLGAQSAVVTVAVVVLVVACTMIFLSEKELSSRWGVTFFGGEGVSAEGVCENAALESRCARLASEHRLTPREAEVLLLLAEKKSIADVEAELFISRGTAKAHLAHIYQKLGIHTRNELLEMAQVSLD